MSKLITFDDCWNYAMLFDKGTDVEVVNDFDSVRFIRIRLDQPTFFKGRANTYMTLAETDTNSEIEIFYKTLTNY